MSFNIVFEILFFVILLFVFRKNALVQFQKNLFSTTNDQNPSSPIPPDALHRDNPDLWNLRVIADKNPK